MKISSPQWVLLLSFGLGASCGITGAAATPNGSDASADSPAAAGTDAGAAIRYSQPPINITFDLHSDPEPPILTLDQRRLYFRRQLANATWLLDAVEPWGVKLSFLAVGEFFEFCVEATEKDVCLPLLRRLQLGGGIIGTHQHCQYQRGPHDWPDIAHCYANPSSADVRKVWADGKRLTDEAIRQALQLTDATAVAAINTASASHAQLPDPNQLMEELGYTIREGGEDQTLVALFGHVPWNPFRPGATATTEDRTTKFVTIPQGMVLGTVGSHLGLQQDGRTPRKQAELLELYATWLERERTGAAPRVWAFGWGVHTQDLDVGSESRAAVTALIPWLVQNFVERTSPAGHAQARFGGYVEVRDEYLAWEKANPDVSSFNYPLSTADYSAYPYLEWANRYLRATNLDSELAGPTGVRVFHLTAAGHALLLAVAGEASGTLDASSLGVATLRRVDLATGATTEVAAASAPVGPGSVVLCAPMECDAILAAGQGGGPAPSDAGFPPGDGGLPGQLCSATGTCPGPQVCCPVGRPCGGHCVPDCRVDGGPGCPSQAPHCDPVGGLCQP